MEIDFHYNREQAFFDSLTEGGGAFMLIGHSKFVNTLSPQNETRIFFSIVPYSQVFRPVSVLSFRKGKRVYYSTPSPKTELGSYTPFQFQRSSVSEADYCWSSRPDCFLYLSVQQTQKFSKEDISANEYGRQGIRENNDLNMLKFNKQLDKNAIF